VTTLLRRWRRDRDTHRPDVEDCQAWACSSTPIIAVDPGAAGVVSLYRPPCWWSGGWEAPTAWSPLRGHDGAVDAARLMASKLGRQDAIAVVESSYAGGRANSQSDLVLARNAGIAIGALLATLGPGFLRVVTVPPSTWQTVLKLKGRVKRPERKAAAQEVADRVFGQETHWTHAPSNLRDPLADALCMAAWWGQIALDKAGSDWRSKGRTAAMVQGPDGR
jgi:hypothetical protein